MKPVTAGVLGGVYPHSTWMERVVTAAANVGSRQQRRVRRKRVAKVRIEFTVVKGIGSGDDGAYIAGCVPRE